MEQLNDLVRLAMRATPDEWTTNDRGGVIAVDDHANDGFVICTTCGSDKSHNAEFIAAADPKTILAIAEAYRALEKRLAELEKQDPVAWTDEQELRDVKNHGCGYLFTVDPVTPNADPRRIINLFSRAAPAINLSELVPDEMTSEMAEQLFFGKAMTAVDVWNACRAAILRKIEEAK